MIFKNMNKRIGFTLIEVNLAVLLISVGLLTLFSLFPLGLRESEMSIVDTQEAMFVDSVLSGLEGNALWITDWDTWKDGGQFIGQLIKNVKPIDGKPFNRSGNSYVLDKSSSAASGVFPDPVDPSVNKEVLRSIRYRLTIQDFGVRKRAFLEVKSGDYGVFDEDRGIYITEFIFMGM